METENSIEGKNIYLATPPWGYPDNLAKRNWKGSKQYCFCTNVETIAHLFFGCHLTRLLWRIIFITFGLTKPNNIVQLFGSWLQGFRWEKKNIIFTGL